MPECMVCGEEDFEEYEGHYFCSTCNTQSQDVRVAVTEIEFQTGTVREIREKRETAIKEKAKDDGRPWSLYEAYTIILRHQVDALIKLGADQKLEEICFQIWTNYLHKLKVAFAANINEQTGVKYERQRDLFIGSTKRPKIYDIIGNQCREGTFGQSQKDIESQMEREANLRALRDEEFYEGDNPLSATSDSIWEYRAQEMIVRERWGRFRKDFRYSDVQKVNMARTLSVCLIGLLYTNPLTTATDLLKWVQEKKVPYLDVFSLLGKDMKLCLNDSKSFGMGSAPTLSVLRFNAGTVAHFLGLNNIPDFPLEELIHKYIILLDLPVELHGYIINLFKGIAFPTNYKQHNRLKRMVDWENIAMAYIVIFLKMFFGLNDSNEIALSECSKSLQEISECSKRLFVWTDWIQHMKDRMHYSEHDKLTNAEKRIKSENLKSRIHLKHKIGLSFRKGRSFKPEVRAKTALPFQILSGRWKAKRMTGSQGSRWTGDQAENDNVISDLLEDTDAASQSEVRASPNDHSSETMQILKNNGDKFRNCTIQHLISPDTYTNDLKNQAEDTEDTNADDSIAYSIDSVYTHDISSSIISNSCESRVLKSSKHGNKSGHEAKEAEEFESQVERDIGRFQELVKQITEIKENMETYLDFENDGKACLSYDRLIRICCFINRSTPADLQAEIKKFEICSFTDMEDPGLSTSVKNIRRLLLRDSCHFMQLKIRPKK